MAKKKKFNIDKWIKENSDLLDDLAGTTNTYQQYLESRVAAIQLAHEIESKFHAAEKAKDLKLKKKLTGGKKK